MPARDSSIRPLVCLLADHLDAALAAAEDLRDTIVTLPPLVRGRHGMIDAMARTTALKDLATRMCRAEETLVGRTVRARERALELAPSIAGAAALARLFVAGTTPLVEALEAYGARHIEDFATGGNVVSWLQSRGVDVAELHAGAAAPETMSPASAALVTRGEGHRVAGGIELGPLMDLLAAFLDALDIEFDLYPESATDTVWPKRAAQMIVDLQPTAAGLVQGAG